MISQSPPHLSLSGYSQEPPQASLPPWKASRKITRKQSMSAFCILQRPSHTLSREAWGRSLPPSIPSGACKALSSPQTQRSSYTQRSTGQRHRGEVSEPRTCLPACPMAPLQPPPAQQQPAAQSPFTNVWSDHVKTPPQSSRAPV